MLNLNDSVISESAFEIENPNAPLNTSLSDPDLPLKRKTLKLTQKETPSVRQQQIEPIKFKTMKKKTNLKGILRNSNKKGCGKTKKVKFNLNSNSIQNIDKIGNRSIKRDNVKSRNKIYFNGLAYNKKFKAKTWKLRPSLEKYRLKSDEIYNSLDSLNIPNDMKLKIREKIKILRENKIFKSNKLKSKQLIIFYELIFNDIINIIKISK